MRRMRLGFLAIAMLAIVFAGCQTFALLSDVNSENVAKGNHSIGNYFDGISNPRSPIEEQSVLLNFSHHYKITHINGQKIRLPEGLWWPSVEWSIQSRDFVLLPPGEYTFSLNYYEDVGGTQYLAAHGFSVNIITAQATAEITLILEPGQYYAFTGTALPVLPDRFVLDYEIKNLAEVDFIVWRDSLRESFYLIQRGLKLNQNFQWQTADGIELRPIKGTQITSESVISGINAKLKWPSSIDKLLLGG